MPRTAPAAAHAQAHAQNPVAVIAGPSAKGWGLLLALGVIWGGAFFLTEISLSELPPVTLAAHRVVWAALGLWLLLWARGALTVAPTRKALIGWAVMGALNNAIPFSLIMIGQTAIEGGLAAIFNAMTAIFGVIVPALFLADERLTATKAIGAGCGLVGVAIIVGQEALAALDPRSLGQLAVLGATVSYALASVWGRVRLGGMPAPINALGMLSASALMMIPAALLVDGPPDLSLSAPVWAATLTLALIGTAGAYLIYFALLREVGAANTMLVTLIIPPIAIILGSMFLNEILKPTAYSGFLVIALGLAIIDGRLSPRRWGRPGRPQ